MLRQQLGFLLLIARPIPTKRELKLAFLLEGIQTGRLRIARPIPTKRELKLKPLRIPCDNMDCKAHPDEKGIETDNLDSIASKRYLIYCKAHPDEKGIETDLLSEVVGGDEQLLQGPSRRKGN